MLLLDALPAQTRQVVEGLQAENARLAKIIQLKDEQIRLLNVRLFGPKSDKLSPAQTALLFQEASVSAGEVEQEARRPEPEKQPPPAQSQKAPPQPSGAPEPARTSGTAGGNHPLLSARLSLRQVWRRASGHRL